MSRVFVPLLLLGAMAGAVGVGRVTADTAAQEETSSLAGHPLVGTWLVETPQA